ncbi:lamin tail domain-containing protein [Actinoplanes sp. L3-i22]|uniref:lamin tail domain-containing protein n=1 Tax=Actinoplanes sp. L3-i22 TaxID=2836373 RepID=UPI001C852B57|nr:lamin tail domain-containing protein [Actinoplanes sp. L3-i22]
MRTSLATLSVLAVAGGVLVAAAPAPAATPALRFLAAQYDSPGTDTRSNASLNAEWIQLVNTGSTAVSLTGWRIVDTSRTYTFGAVTIAGRGGTVTLHTGKGTDTATVRYWNSGNYVWNNTGDTATLRTAAGQVHDTCTWKQQAGRTKVSC